MTEESDEVSNILQPYLTMINETPVLLSLLYDADVLPEQISSARDAIFVAAICTAYQLGVYSVDA